MRYMKYLTAGFLIGLTFLICLSFTSKSGSVDPYNNIPHKIDTLQYPSEKNLQNVQQLTFGGDNAEAYFSFDSKWIVFQRTQPKDGVMCDQIFIGKVPKQGEAFTYKMVSTGKGRTTCGAFLKDGKHIVYASTHLGADTCPPVPDRKKSGLCMTAMIFLWQTWMVKS
jgi:TolB protein